MIQAIDRAFDVLHFLARRPGGETPLGEIAQGVGLAKPTCVHILKTLCALNAVEQVAPRRGYCLGPALLALASRGGVQAAVLAVAEPLMRELAGRTRETVQLAVLRGLQRFTICQVDGSHDICVSDQATVDEDIYPTAGGRLLLASATDAERDAFVEAAGLPGQQWAGITSRKKLDEALEMIRRDGHVVFTTPGHTVAMAYPVEQGGRVVASLGLFLPEFRFEGEHRDEVLSGMARTAAAITAALAT